MRALLILVLLTSSAIAKPWLWKQEGEYLHDVEVAPDGSVAAFANGTLLRFSRDGKLTHKRELPATSLVSAVSFAPDGDLLAVGYFEKSLDLGGGELKGEDRDGFVARYKPDGTLRWSVQLKAGTMAPVRGIAVTADRVLAVGMFRDKVSVGAKTLAADDDAGFALLLDAQGKVLAFEKLQAELEAACATSDGFVVGGRDRSDSDKVFARGLGTQLETRWTLNGSEGEVAGVACRADGTSFVASWGQNPKNNFSNDVAVLELDGKGTLVRTLPIATADDDQPQSIAATATEVVITTRLRKGDGPVATRVTRFGAKGKQLSAETFKASDTVWVRAAYRGKDLVLAGEVQRGAKVKIRGTQLSGPVVFVSAP